MRKPTLLIMAAGMGSRYGGLKQLDEVGPSGETILDFSISDAISAGFKDVVFVIRKTFEEAFRERFVTHWGTKITAQFAYQEVDPELDWRKKKQDNTRQKPWGTGHAVLCAAGLIDQTFAVINADDFYGREAFVRMYQFLTTDCQPDHFGMVHFLLGRTLSPFGQVSRGVCSLDDQSQLVLIQELSGIEASGQGLKNTTDPTLPLSEDTPVSMNFWGFHPSIFRSLEKDFKLFSIEHQDNKTAEFYLPSHVFSELKLGNVRVSTFSSTQHWYGITYREDKAFVVDALNKMFKTGIYKTPLWR